MDSSPLRAIDHDGLLQKLSASFRPILKQISEQIDGYSDEELRSIVEDNLGNCEKYMLRLREEGVTDEKALGGAAIVLAYQQVIEPRKEEVAEIFRSLPSEDAQVMAFLERYPFQPNYCEPLLKGEFMEEYRYGPLKKRMKERLEPFLKERLPLDHDGLSRKLGASIAPILQKISDSIGTYGDRGLQAVVLKHLANCTKDALELKGWGFTDDEIFDNVAKELIYQEVIKPQKGEAAEIFERLYEKDSQVRAYLELNRFLPNHRKRLMKVELVEKCEPLQKEMRERLKPFLKKELAPVLSGAGPGRFSFMSLLNWLWPG